MRALLALEDRTIVLSIAILSAFMLASAHGFETFGHLPPCDLCLQQREAYWAALPLFGFAYLASFAPTPQVKTVLMVLGTCALAYGTWLAGFHTGVEQGWWPGPETCTGAPGSVLDMLDDKNPQIVRCDEIPWSLLGISMAGYNFLISSVLTIVSLVPLKRSLNI